MNKPLKHIQNRWNTKLNDTHVVWKFIYIHSYKYMGVYTHIHIYTHTCRYTYVYIYTHIHIYELYEVCCIQYYLFQ